ncbi:twin-arginine translocase subunit TatC [Virgibacillus necropolis]|uniref:Sec-independent protein translocase protein TatC n=1 Tax=Virgibacillus necropolis TaxID=163877 RepID=A0A221M7G1_9BACI|nr:twin-arginine translocase subunit TatC [Virgibacillus necropolis]ASN03586.1 twin-arginine translocase subunit TatC [Virgibacillus necropolis]
MKNNKMAVLDHLEELRKRIIITVSAFLLFFIAAMIYVGDIYGWLVKDLDIQLAILGPTEILWVYLMLAGIVSLAVTIPIAAGQAWLFIRPALTKREQKTTLAYIPALFILFILGIGFGYYLIFPIVLEFLLELAGDHFMTFFTTEKYFRFMLRMTLPFGILFELPAIVMFLTSLGIVNPYQLKKIRKQAYFTLIVISVLITPPDLISDVLVILPLLILYECSISLSKVVYRKKQRSVATAA